MINKNRFGVANDKKLLRKIGKQWVTVSAMTLALLGGGTLATSVVTHAASTNPAVEAQNTNNVKKQLNSNLDKAYQATQSASGSSAASSNGDANGTKASQSSATPQGIMKTASLLHANMLNNAQKPNTTPSSASAESNASNQSASSASSKASSSNDAMNTLTFGNSAQQKRGWNFVQNGVNHGDYDNSQENNHKNLLSQKPLLKNANDNLDYFSGGKPTTENDNGLTYLKYPNGGAEFTSGNLTNMSVVNSFSDAKGGNYDLGSQMKAIKFDNGVTTNNVTSLSGMFKHCPQYYFDLNFDTSNISDMSYMFSQSEGNNPRVIILGPKFDTSKTFKKHLYGPSGYDAQFDMFGSDNLSSLTIQSSNTKFDNNAGLPNKMYQKIGNTNYTSATPVNLMDGSSHVGTFLAAPNVKNVSDTVAFYTKHGNDNVLVSKATVSGADGSSVNISKDVPSDYQLANGNPNVTLTANTTDDIELTLKNGQSINNPYIPEKVTPDSANADVQYQYNNQTVNSDSTDYQGNNYQATDAGDNGTTISDNNEKGLPQGWHLANKDTSISYDNGKHPVAIDPNHVSDNVIYQYNGQNVNNGYQLGSHSFGGNDYRATQAGNNGIDIKQANATGLRDGYTLVNADNNIQFDGETKYIPVKPNQISDKGTLTLNYVESNGRTDKTVTLHPAIKGNVDDTLTLAKPLDYAEDNYTVPSSDFTWTIKPSNNEPSKTFTYNAPTAGNVTIQYYDTATGNHLTQFDKTLTASDMEKAPYNLNWIVGNTVKLGIKGANDNAIDVLQAPAGYHFAKNYPAESVTLPEAQSGNRQGLTLHVGLMLMARPVTPKKPNKHNSGKVTPFKPNKPASSGNVTPIQPSSASVTPSSSASAVPSSASVAPSSKASSAPSSITPSSASSIAPSVSIAPASQSVAPVVTPSSKASSASISAKPNVAPKSKATVPSHVAKPIAHHHSHKNTNGNAHLAHLVREATAKLSTVKSNVAKRNVLKGQLNDSKLTTHAKATANEPTTDKSVADNTNTSATNTSVAPSNVSTKSVTEPSNAPKSHVATQSTATTYTNRKKLPQTGETNAHTGVVALIAMAAGAIIAGFGKVFDRKHNE